jgi:hypothetical protein
MTYLTLAVFIFVMQASPPAPKGAGTTSTGPSQHVIKEPEANKAPSAMQPPAVVPAAKPTTTVVPSTQQPTTVDGDATRLDKSIGSVTIIAKVTAAATLLYGISTFLLWVENKNDRKQRDRHFQDEKLSRRLSDLHSAFYDAWGYWEGHRRRSGDSRVDSSQAGTVFEALIRLECQLRLNDYKKEAHDLGFAVRKLEGVDQRLAETGVAIGLLPSEYRQAIAVGFVGGRSEPR